MSGLISKVDQSGATADGDIVARDKITNNYAASPVALGIVGQLLQKLKEEIENNDSVRHTVESLQYFYENKSVDGIDGLEAKLNHAGRQHEIFMALEKKELFVKTLEKWSMYASAQEIFAFLLAKVEHGFAMYVAPNINQLNEAALNEVIDVKVISPTVQECGVGVFTLNYSIVMGMFYWLAEQCYVRWHQ